MATVALVLLYFSVAVLIMASVGTSVMAFALRSRFPDVWRNWGEPVEWVWLTRTSLGRHVFGFLDSRAYRATGDAKFVLFCELLRGTWYVALVLFPVALALFFYTGSQVMRKRFNSAFPRADAGKRRLPMRG